MIVSREKMGLKEKVSNDSRRVARGSSQSYGTRVTREPW